LFGKTYKNYIKERETASTFYYFGFEFVERKTKQQQIGQAEI